MSTTACSWGWSWRSAWSPTWSGSCRLLSHPGSVHRSVPAIRRLHSGRRAPGDVCGRSGRPRSAQRGRPGVQIETYGLAEDARWQARDLTPNGWGFDASIWHDGEHVADLSLPVPAATTSVTRSLPWPWRTGTTSHRIWRQDAEGLSRRRPAVRIHRRGWRRDRHRRLRTPSHRDRRDLVRCPHALSDPADMGRISAPHLQSHAGTAAGLHAQLR